MTSLTFQPVATTLPDWRKREIVALREKLASDGSAYESNGVRYWRSNDAVIPPFVYRDALVECPEQQIEAREQAMTVFLSEYKRTQPSEPSWEEQAEARAAHGAGVTLVDVFTGRRWTT
jgi:hypothetical protein